MTQAHRPLHRPLHRLPHRRAHCLLALAAALAASAGAQAQEPAAAAAADFGRTKEAAIEVCKPDGQRRYLARLVCPDSSHPRFERQGSVGERVDAPEDEEVDLEAKLEAMSGFSALKPGQRDFHMVDRYLVDCNGQRTALYLDMYHCDTPVPRIAPTGFTLIE